MRVPRARREPLDQGVAYWVRDGRNQVPMEPVSRRSRSAQPVISAYASRSPIAEMEVWWRVWLPRS